MPARRLLCVAVWLLAAAPAFGQITWNFTYSDTAGTGFNDNTTDAGQTQTRSQLRKGSLVAATQYLNNFLDGRGTINANLNTSANSIGTPVLASFGASQLYGPLDGSGNLLGSFQNGGFYQGGRTNARPSSGVDGSGQFNFGYAWNYAGQQGGNASNAIDMVTVAIHELTHGLGFNAQMRSTGQGGFASTLGTPDLYGGYARFLQRGNGPLNPTSGLLNTDITSAGYGSFTGAASTLTNGNDATTGLFFGGAYAREVYGGAVPLYAPSPYESGSSVSHVNDTKAVMNPSVSYDTVKRFQAYEIGMLMDVGWNVYNWNGSTGNWADGASDLAASRWTTDSGIVFSSGFTDAYNINASQGQAPVLPVYGQTTANIVLNFTSTAAGHTSTNDVGNVRLARLNFSGTAAGTTAVAGGTLNFGLNADGSPSVLAPKIVQSGAGAVSISSAVQLNAISDYNVVVSGQTLATYKGHNGVTVEGTGSGTVTLSGNISGTGGVTKNGSTFDLVLSGTNSYTGATTVNGGALYVDGSLSNAASGVTVNGGTLGGTNGTISRAITVNSGGTLEAGTSTTIGTLNVKAATTVNGGGSLRAELGSGTSSDKLDMTGGNYTLDLKNGSLLALSANGFTRTSTTYTLADLDSTTAALLKLNGTDVAAGTTITTFTSTGGNAGTNSNGVGDVDLVLSGFDLTSGDRFVLQRNGTGDLVLTFTPVPEPAGVMVLCGLAGAAVAGWRRWQKGRCRLPGGTPEPGTE